MPGIKNVFGGGQIAEGRGFPDVASVMEAMDVLEKGDCKIIDTAQIYGHSEKSLGKVKAGDRFIIDTKAKGGFVKGSGTKENIIKDAQASKERLGVNVDIFYLHAPDKSVPLEETLAGVNEVYKSGFFKRLGLSNYMAEDVQKTYDHCKSQGYPLPTVYQGNYSAVARKQEEVLFPTLRKLGIAFYAYSPIAGGFLTKSKQQVLDGAGKFNKGNPIGLVYATMFSKPAYLNALKQWETIARDEGCSRADLGFRWVKYNSPLKDEYGDAIIIGASSLAQLKETLGAINKGPLSSNAVKRIDEMWETIKHEAPLDCYYK